MSERPWVIVPIPLPSGEVVKLGGCWPLTRDEWDYVTGVIHVLEPGLVEPGRPPAPETGGRGGESPPATPLARPGGTP